MYALVKKNQKHKSNSILELLGYQIRINKTEVVIYNQTLIDILIKEKLIPEYNKLVKKVLVFLEEDGSSDNAAYLLDELARLYSIYLNKYEKYLSKKEKDKFMKNLRIITNELKKFTHTMIKAESTSHTKTR